jgi:hypothetical protein
MSEAHAIQPLTPDTYPAWLALAEKHNGVWGGCGSTSLLVEEGELRIDGLRDFEGVVVRLTPR